MLDDVDENRLEGLQEWESWRVSKEAKFLDRDDISLSSDGSDSVVRIRRA